VVDRKVLGEKVLGEKLATPRHRRTEFELRQIYNFIVVADTNNFHKAARHLNIAQSALSRQIAALEKALQARLFERLASGVRLTPAGEVLLGEARSILIMAERAAERTRLAAHGRAGIIHLGFNSAALRHPFVLRTLRAMRTRFPELQIQAQTLLSHQQEAELKLGRLDAGFLLEHDKIDGYEALLVAVDDFDLALPQDHPLALTPRLRLSDLQQQNFIWTEPSHYPMQHARLLAACASGGLFPTIVQHTDSEQMILNMVRCGFGLAFLPRSLPAPGDIKMRRLEDLSVPISLELVWRKDRVSENLHQFILCAREQISSAETKRATRDESKDSKRTKRSLGVDEERNNH
jgi:DNA-binding transcriptional LysR family regulator